jgi:DNA-binding NarL/FixJ family response regulator
MSARAGNRLDRQAIIGHETANGLAPDPAIARFGFSQRELQVAHLIARGLANKEVAALLGTAPDTVRKQSIAIYRKAAVSNRTELARLLLGDGADSGRAYESLPARRHAAAHGKQHAEHRRP